MGMRTRELLEFVALFAAAAGLLYAGEQLGTPAQVPLSFAVALWAGLKTLYYLLETLRHLA